MRLFGSEKLMDVFNTLGVPEGEQIQHKMLTSAIEKAQQKIEGNNFGIRKNLLEYDQVMNDQREIIYKERRRVLDGENMRDAIFKMITDRVESSVDTCISAEIPKDEWDLNELNQLLISIIPMQPVTQEDVDSVKNNKELKQSGESLGQCFLYCGQRRICRGRRCIRIRKINADPFDRRCGQTGRRKGYRRRNGCLCAERRRTCHFPAQADRTDLSVL